PRRSRTHRSPTLPRRGRLPRRPARHRPLDRLVARASNQTPDRPRPNRQPGARTNLPRDPQYPRAARRFALALAVRRRPERIEGAWIPANVHNTPPAPATHPHPKHSVSHVSSEVRIPLRYLRISGSLRTTIRSTSRSSFSTQAANPVLLAVIGRSTP